MLIEDYGMKMTTQVEEIKMEREFHPLEEREKKNRNELDTFLFIVTETLAEYSVMVLHLVVRRVLVIS